MHNVAGEIRPNWPTIPPRPASELKLIEAEIALLENPDWVTEDDADAIMSLRSEREGGAIPLEVIKKEIRERRVAR